ncbi:hypothetical protein KAX03_02530 [Candidatus Bathyarchaeota archaeon]|nr:hypothetical protein [Candidatus Bathyarchaeota archaeon]
MSKVLEKRLKALRIDLNNLVIKEKLMLGVDKKRDTVIADLVKLSKRLNEILKSSSKDIIIEGHYSSVIVPPDIVSHVFILRKNPYNLTNVLRKRGFNEKKVKENVLAELLGICLLDAINTFGIDKVSEVDVTNITEKKTAEKILSIVDGVQKKVIGKVDWIKKLEEEGHLNSLL